MANALAFIGGGLLQGVGKGLALSGKEKREKALADLENTRSLARDAKQFENQQGLLGTRIDARKTAAEKANENALTAAELKAGATVERGRLATETAEGVATKATEDAIAAAELKATNAEEVARIRANKKTDTSASDSRIFDDLQDIYKSKDDLDEDVTNFGAISRAIADMPNASPGLKALGKEAGRKGKGIANLDIRRRAEEFADQMVEEQAGTFSTDASDFKDDGGSRTVFRARMVREYIAKNGGSAAAAPETRQATTGGAPFVGDTAPPNFPNARRAPDGFWYVPDPARGPNKFQRVQK